MTEKDERLLQIHREIEERLQRTVRISHDEAERIATADLLSKYKSAKIRKCDNDATALKKVLITYYLTQDEFELYT